MTDLARIETRHQKINERMENWARWVRVKPQAWGAQPMFRYAKSNARQWEADPHISVSINSLEAHQTEKMVASLPEKHRDAVRWFYVFHWVHPGVMQRRLAVTQEGLTRLVTNGLDMLVNRIGIVSHG